MTTNQLWLVGSLIVPLATLATFAVMYVRRYKEYLLTKNSCSNSQFLEDHCRSYVSAKNAHEKLLKSKFWWYFFGEKYVTLLDSASTGFVYEVDKLDSFEAPEEHYPTFRRKSFMGQWIEMHTYLCNASYYNDDKWSHEVNPRFGDRPLGWMSVIIAGKLYELYKKHALYLLRTKGYGEFDKFLGKYHDKSSLYPFEIPFSAIHGEQFHVKVIYENASEIAERVRNEVKTVTADRRKRNNKPLSELLQGLTEGFIFSSHAKYYYSGLSEVRKEVFDLLEQEKVVS